MIRGLYTSAVGMTTQMKRMDVVTNNIANVDTTGFKKDTVVTQSFSEKMMSRLNDPKYSKLNASEKIGVVSLGVFVDNVFTDFSSGSLKKTNADLDIAISGDGFFAISSKNINGQTTEKYSRDGSFTISNTGVLITKSGDPVLGEKGPITIQNGKVSIDENGNVYANDELINKLKLVDFSDKTTLRKTGENLYETTKDSKMTKFNATVQQGFLESSNVNSVKEMVDMISVSRIYEANQRMIGIHDTILGKAVNEVGRKQ